MTSEFIKTAIQKHYYDKGCTLQVKEFTGGIRIFRPDILICTKSMYLLDIEVKISRADFKRDFKKITKHLCLQNGQCGVNYFYFACPTNLIKPSEIPCYAGLIYVTDTGKIEIISPAKLLNRNKVDNRLLLQIARSLSYKCIFKG